MLRQLLNNRFVYKPRAGVLILTLLICFLALSAVRGAGDERFDSQTIPFEGRIIHTTSAELNGRDGKELIAFEVLEDGSRRLLVFEKGFGRGFSDRPALGIPLPDLVFATQALDIDDDNLEELLLLGLESVYYLEFEEGAYARELGVLASYERLFSVPGPETVSNLEFAFDLNNDGIYELLLPCWKGVGLFVQQSEEYSRVHQFQVKQRAGVTRNGDFLNSGAAGAFSFRFPQIVVADLNTDRNKDVFVETESGLSVFYQTGNLQFAEEPGKSLDVRQAYFENLYFSTSEFADINGDGLTDYCRVFTQGENYDAKSLVEVFLGNIHDGYPTRPSKRIVLDEFVVGLALVDLNHNGSASLIVATQQLSTISMVKSLMVNRIPVELKIYGTTAGLIDEEPIAVKKTSCPIELIGGSFPARYIGCMSGDIDFDRMNELMIIDHDRELQIYQGSAEEVFGDKPVFTMSAENVFSIDALDLDGDNKSDLLLGGIDEDANPVLMILWAT